ncbi:hypothetical protein [Oligoflexus tunisiensis]|uniref:hypothetical protein n=1 Tax=Oligoflexus tunisiensis TaxID=708132 RepID=UPI000B14E933|nr:hypothetical protein [Oligoflexus tunisiensis]
MSAGTTRTAALLLALFSACGATAPQRPSRVDTIDRFPAPRSSEMEINERKPVIDEVQFRALIHRVMEPYQKLAALHNAKIVLRIPVDATVSKDCMSATDEDTILRCSWLSDFTNADAGRSRQEENWSIGVGGGLARLPTMTPEGFTLVLCHEIGHLFGGFPFLREGFTGLALPVSVDGQADYFAAQVCLRKIWAQDDNAKNAEGVFYEQMIEPLAVTQCNSVHEAKEERELCYKTVFAGMSFIKTLSGKVDPEVIPSVGTPDMNEVGVTDNYHPSPQCRLDTFLAGALCPTVLHENQNPAAVYYDETRIPGYQLSSPGGEVARSQALAASCHEDFWPEGARPRCWFSPEQTQEGGWMNEL